MAVLKYDVSGVEGSGGGGPQPKPGLYKGKITKFDLTKPDGKDRRFELIFEVINRGEFKGSRLYEYVNVESEAAAWKLRQLTDALGLKPKGTINTEKHIGDVLQLQVQGDSYNGEYRARIGRMMALPEDEVDEAEDAEDTEEEDEEPEADEDEGTEDGYDEMSLKELRAELKERGLPTRGTQDVLIERLREADTEAEDEPEAGEEEEPEADDAEGDAETYNDWDVEELRAELKERGLRTVGSKKALVARLEKDDASSDEPF